MAERLVMSVIVTLACVVTAASKPQQAVSVPPACPATIGETSPIAPAAFFGSSSAHWNGNLYVGALWTDGTIVFRPGGPGFVYPDGSLGMKIAWYRANGLHGALRIQGKRLDAPGPPLRARIPHGYGDTGFQATEVIFPAEGCWQVTGTVSRTSVTFVTRVVRVQRRTPK